MWKRFLAISSVMSLSCLPGMLPGVPGLDGSEQTNSRSITGSNSQPFKLSPGDKLDFRIGERSVQAVFRKTVRLEIGDDFQGKVNANPAGTMYIVAGGTHRGQSIVPKDGDMFIGESGALMSGAKILTGCRPIGTGLWEYLLQDTLVPMKAGECAGNYERLPNESGVEASIRLCLPCVYPEMLFITDIHDNQTLLTRVSFMGQVSEGTWYLDYDSPQRVVVSKDYSGSIVELSIKLFAFGYDDPKIKASNVTIRNLIVEKYANPSQTGAIGWFRPGAGWDIRDNDVRWNHGGGIKFNGAAIVQGNNVHHNGQIGIIAGDGNSEQRFGGYLPEWGWEGGDGGSGGLVENNVISHNRLSEVGFSQGWEAGGTKFSQCRNLVVRNNYVHDNDGIGLWSDFSYGGTIYESNRIDNNTWEGLSVEITEGPTLVQYNDLRGNGSYITDPNIYGGQILVSNSPDVEITENALIVNSGYGNGITIRNSSRDVNGKYIEALKTYVHDNILTIKGPGGSVGITGGQADMNPPVFYLVKNNQFKKNSYHVADENGKYWRWDSQPLHDYPPFLTWQEWREMCQDSSGKMDTDTGKTPSVGKGFTPYTRPSYENAPKIKDMGSVSAEEIVAVLNFMKIEGLSADVFFGRVKLSSKDGIKVTGGTAAALIGF